MTALKLLALGELEPRNDLFRRLVERDGYRTIAVESDCLMGLITDDYVTSGTGTLDEVMDRGFSHPCPRARKRSTVCSAPTADGPLRPR